MKRLTLLLLILGCSMSLMADRKLYRYGWEDVDLVGYPEAILGEFEDGDVTGSVNTETVTVREGTQSLKLIDNSTSDPTWGEQAYICSIQNLQDGDIVKANFWRYNATATAGCRIGANYIDSNFAYVTYFADGNNNDAGIGTTGDWENTSYTWVYVDGTTAGTRGPSTGMMILARPYTNPGDICYIDSLEVEVPDYAQIILPGPADEVITIPDLYDPNSVQHRAYSWEDGFADVLGFYGNVYDPTNTTSPDPVRTGSRSLKVSEFPVGETPQAYVAMIKGLRDGEKVTAGFWAYDDTPGEASAGYPSVRIWAHYADSNDITSYYGSAGGNETWSGDATWSRLENEWTFASGGGEADALVIEARLYTTDTLTSQEFWIDDVNVIAPETATIVFPGDVYKAADYATSTYSWQNFNGPDTEQNVVLGTHGNLEVALELFDSYNGDGKSLLLTEGSQTYTTSTLRQSMARGYEVNYNSSITPEGYLAVITGLTPGQRVKAGFQAKSNTANDNAGVRIWGHYIYDETDLSSYAGSAGGFAVYSNPDDWTKLTRPWYFQANPYTDTEGVERVPVGLVITARAYSTTGEGGLIDDLFVEAPVTATVGFPDPSNDPICVGGLPEFDFNLDCRVNLADFAEFAQGWLGCNLQPQEDCGL